MAVTCADRDVESSERAVEITALSDELDAVVGDLEAYSQDPLGDAPKYEFDEPERSQCESEEPCDDRTDGRSIVLAAVFFFVQMVLVVEMVFVVFFEPVYDDGAVGSVITVLLGGALFGNFGAAIAAAWAVEADRRWQASVPDSDDWMELA